MADQYEVLSDEQLLSIRNHWVGKNWNIDLSAEDAIDMFRAIERAVVEAYVFPSGTAERNRQRCYEIQRDELIKVNQRCTAVEQRAREFLAATKAKDDLFAEIRRKGMPPHTDYWHQSIDEANARVLAATSALSDLLDKAMKEKRDDDAPIKD